MNHLIEPHGGKLCELMVSETRRKQLQEESLQYSSLTLNDRQLCDVEMLLNGGFSPLKGFLGQTDYNLVLADNRLSDGTVWPIPITLDVSEKFSQKLQAGDKIMLRDHEGVALGVLTISDKWSPDLQNEAENVYGSSDILHPAVNYLLHQSGKVYLGGEIEGLEYPRHYDYQLLRHSPSELREKFEKMGWTKVVAFQTRNPMHCAHKELVARAAREIGGNLLIHPVV
ncbi:uncharacterized protein METZ01_LOCUS483903, partial [marine metagenome]